MADAPDGALKTMGSGGEHSRRALNLLLLILAACLACLWAIRQPVVQRRLFVWFSHSARAGSPEPGSRRLTFEEAMAPLPAPRCAPDDPLPGSFVQVDDLPEAIGKVTPLYPDLARQAGVEGTVIVEVLVGKDGTVHDAFVARSIPMLDRAALAAAWRWWFEPGRVARRPVAVWVALPVKFTLH